MNVAQVSPAQVEDWYSHHAAGLLIDVRERWEHGTACVDHSAKLPSGLRVCNIPMSEFMQRLTEVPHDTPLLLLCHHGVRSQSVANWLAHNDFGPIANLSGGIDAWSRELDAAIPLY